MVNSFYSIYTFIGGLGLIFYGMKSMSESLQSLAGDVIRKVISSLTTNRILAVLIGIIVTMMVQSSTITTIMTVGLVNAGLMKLSQAIGVIFGANVGTTITGWIISIHIWKYGLLIVAIGVFFNLFSKNESLKQTGQVLFSIGLIFMGLDFMNSAIRPIKSNPTFLNIFSYFSSDNYLSFFASMLTGCIFTMMFQSSTAMLAVTMALATSGVIGFKTSAALIMGENIGTTITATLAAVGGNVHAKRAAKVHTLFNLCGAVIIFLFFYPYSNFIDAIIPGNPDFLDADGSRPYIASHIAAFHTGFNVTTVILFLPFTGYVEKLVVWLTPDRSESKIEHHLLMLGDPRDAIPATGILQAHSEIKKFKDILNRMANVTKQYLEGTGDPVLFEKIRSYENISDNIQKEVTIFLCHLMERPMTHSQSVETQALVKLADEYESIADYLYRAANYKIRFKETFLFTENLKAEFFAFFDEVWHSVEIASVGIYDEKSHDISLCVEKSEELRRWADDIRDHHLDRVSKGEYGAMSALTYSDMVVSLRKIRTHAVSVANAIDLFVRKE